MFGAAWPGANQNITRLLRSCQPVPATATLLRLLPDMLGASHCERRAAMLLAALAPRLGILLYFFETTFSVLHGGSLTDVLNYIET